MLAADTLPGRFGRGLRHSTGAVAWIVIPGHLVGLRSFPRVTALGVVTTAAIASLLADPAGRPTDRLRASSRAGACLLGVQAALAALSRNAAAAASLENGRTS